MKKAKISFIGLLFAAILAMTVTILPFSASAGDVTPVIITLDASGIPITTSGEGWSYDASTETLILSTGYSFTISGELSNIIDVINMSTISSGTFNGTVSSTGTISGGTFNGSVKNNDEGTISDGTFNGNVTNNADATISGGTFSKGVENHNIISGGTFSGDVENKTNGTISGGTFAADKKVDNTGTISGGTFSGYVENDATISDGTFNENVENKADATISGGSFNEAVFNFGTLTGGSFLGMTIDAAAKVGATFNLTNLTYTGGEPVTCGTSFTAKLTAKDGYKLPEKITLVKNYRYDTAINYTYDKSTGEINVSAIGSYPLTITAAGVKLAPPAPKDELPPEPTGRPSEASMIITPVQTTNPVVGDSETKKMWENIAAEMNKLADGKAVQIRTNGRTKVPAYIVRIIKQKSLNVHFAITSARTVTINGKDIENITPLDLSMNKWGMTKSAAAEIDGAITTKFVFNTDIKAKVTISYKTEYAGKTATLYKYVGGKAIMCDETVINENGKAAALETDGTGRYFIVIA